MRPAKAAASGSPNSFRERVDPPPVPGSASAGDGSRFREQSWRPDVSAWAAALRARPKGEICEREFVAWLGGPLRSFLPFERAIAGYSSWRNGVITVHRRVAIGYGPDWLAELPKTMPVETCNCFSYWLKTREPLLVDPSALPPFLDAVERDMIRRFDLGLIIIHGVVDPIAGCGSYVALSGIPQHAATGAIEASELIAPVLHALFMRILQPEPSKLDGTGLTPRQLQIARMAAGGMDDKSIARELGISEHTIANHLRQVFRRLGVRKRGHLRIALR